MNKSLALRQAALKIAGQGLGGFDLSRQSHWREKLEPLVGAFIRPALSPMLVGHEGSEELQIAIQNLQLGAKPLIAEPAVDWSENPRVANELLRSSSITNYQDLIRLQKEIKRLSSENPRAKSENHDRLYVCFTLNGVEADETKKLLSECYRVLNRNGTLMMLVLLADERHDRLEIGPVRSYPIVQAPTESGISELLEQEGFHGITYHQLSELPLQITEGVELKPFLIEAYKGKSGPCFEQGHALLYRGPWLQVCDDDGHVYRRGVRTAVCAKTYNLLLRAPYHGQFVGIPCYNAPPLERALLFDCNTPAIRDPAVTKGAKPLADSGSCCTSDDGNCCQ
ncbi:hypothetical protein [Pseudomonas fluorescens]|uniref:Uncharacterized protein n=1 Tax=Pseudomonas fluorescens TaxID=294 RepID=A0A944DKN9_PSEFL|nr:hypothetical protein [Pseudomonas fluorescens]MBT2295595.1 hypothetical protein [Pseudomonas fluorescens]MBT2310505.1 hypothetical protein [Pseudomonas fluorescens]MBT2314013.1 hypothetical protein [Pseudomonas fluorescens]MBT2318729.1 hypothetical protein [Pseudomonas fluorescens]MBT2329493.1 hypothetical protein [Pseudomonas fluorescens]